MEGPSLSSAGIGSRFVTQDDVESARARRDEQWKAAYARLGMEPPPVQQEDFSDGRSLAEKLAANKIAKQEEWEEKTKLANQFRALEEDEVMFLDSIRERQEEEERQRKEQDGEEVQNFREAVAARSVNPPPMTSKPAAPVIVPKPATAPARKKGPLKGVMVKKKAKPAATTTAKPKDQTKDEEVEQPDAKRRRISES